ncbi:MAG: hypothetical protein MUF61_00670 [archaeon]|jgi:hypothetical protein|nr:hypothetical protein [archaeon]
MKIARADNFIWVFLPRDEAESVRRGEGVNFLEARDAERRRYVLINTAQPEHYVRFQENDSPSGYNTIKLNDLAHANLLKDGKLRHRDGRIEVNIEIESDAAEKLLSN